MSKFEPLESYLSAKGQYKLLPLRFESISDDEVVLTNAVGEFTFLSRSKLQDLVARRLGPEDPDYAVLRAKHFIREEGDEAALELLALKTRTRLSRLANFTNLHIFVVSLRCDHSCQYCQVSRQSEDKAAFDMTPAAAVSSVCTRACPYGGPGGETFGSAGFLWGSVRQPRRQARHPRLATRWRASINPERLS